MAAWISHKGVVKRFARPAAQEQAFERMGDGDSIEAIDKTGGHLAAQAQAAVDLAQEQRASVAGEVAAAEVGDDAAGAQIAKEQRLGHGQGQRGRAGRGGGDRHICG